MLTTLDFTFLVFQPYPKHEAIYYWLDGSKNRHRIPMNDFFFIARNTQPEVIGHIQQACLTYSFYLWSKPDASITHLIPSGDKAEYPDEVMKVVTNKRDHPVEVNQSIEDRLMQFGFLPPSSDSIKNLKTSLVKEEPKGILYKAFARFRK